MFRKRLFLYFFVVYAAFAAIVTLLQYNREVSFKVDKLNSNLDSYASLVHNYIQRNSILDSSQFNRLDSLYRIIDNNNLRVTVVAHNGDVFYDSDVYEISLMQNHLKRPEVQAALRGAHGTDTRLSASTGTPYYYYAKQYKDYFVRTALDYDVSIREFLRAERFFFVIIGILFLLMTLLLLFISGKFGNTLSKLKDFALKAASDEKIDPNIEFPRNELGVISRQIVHIYDNLKKTRDTISQEREKLIRHLYISREGVAIFSPSKTKIFANSLFIQNIIHISDKPSVNPEQVFGIDEFNEVKSFIDKNLAENLAFLQAQLPSKSFTISKRGRYFAVNVIIFSDRTFEISLNDITTQETEKNLKQQLTSNIAHELRTPVTSILGYLETILSSKELDDEKRTHFIERANVQANRLSELISDISVLNRIEENAVSVDKDTISIPEIVSEVMDNMKAKLDEKGIKAEVKISEGIAVKGNYSLLYSIFQNLFENSIIHAGENIEVSLQNYFEDDTYYYFSYADNGIGIPYEHIGRIFDRFYRVDQGRGRQTGGTGLGLAIIKNAVLFHGGDISVKNRDGGGVEFFFSIRKEVVSGRVS